MSVAAVRRANGLPSSSPVVISQVGRAHAHGPRDELGMPAHWIELYNRSGEPVTLRGYSITDTLRQTGKWPLPGVVLPPRGYAMVWADGEARFDAPVRFGFDEVRGRAGWHRYKDYHETQGGETLRASVTAGAANESHAAARLVYRVDVPRTDRYALWLRVKPPGPDQCVLGVQVDARPPATVRLRPHGAYQMAPVHNPEARDGLWAFPRGAHALAVTLRHGEVVCDGGVLIRTDAPPGEVAVHANFKPRADGELVALFSPRGLLADHVFFPALPFGQSYRRVPPDGDDFALGPAAPHGLPPAAPPRPSHPNGPCPVGQSVTVAPATAGDDVRYTLNGALPTAADPVFPGSLAVTEPTTLRLRAFRDNAWPSPPVTRVFWPGPLPAVPVVWLAADEANLRDRHRGILVNTQARAAYGERPVYACLMRPNGAVQAVDAGMRIQGRSTRDYKVKLPFRIICRPQYGDPVWPGPLFADPGPESHASMVLRSYNIIYHPLGLAVMRRLGSPAPRTDHVVLMVNSRPFGLYFLLGDVAEPDWLEAQYGHLDLDVIKHKAVGDAVILGTSAAYDEVWGGIAADTWGPVTPERVAGIVDLRAFTRWIAGVQFLGLRDNDQGFFVRDRRDPAQRWSFLNWDFDGAFHDFASGAINSLRSSAFALEGVRGKVFRALMDDPGYRAFFIEEFQALLNHPLAPGPWLEQVAAYEEALLPLVDFESQGRNNQQPEFSPPEERTPEYLRAQLAEELATARAFFETRGATVRELLASGHGLAPPVPVRIATDLPLFVDDWPVTGTYAGQYFPGTTLRVHSPDESPLAITVNGTAIAADCLVTNLTRALEIRVTAR